MRAGGAVCIAMPTGSLLAACWLAVQDGVIKIIFEFPASDLTAAEEDQEEVA